MAAAALFHSFDCWRQFLLTAPTSVPSVPENDRKQVTGSPNIIHVEAFHDSLRISCLAIVLLIIPGDDDDDDVVFS